MRRQATRWADGPSILLPIAQQRGTPWKHATRATSDARAIGDASTAYALACFVNAAYRLVPARVGPDDDRTLLSGEKAGDALG